MLYTPPPLLISIHAPRVGSDKRGSKLFQVKNPFQSTLPVWGATLLQREYNLLHMKFQSTLPVWGATKVKSLLRETVQISIHAPRVGSDFTWRYQIHIGRQISIHAPRVGSDVSSSTHHHAQNNFNPRSPCGERR